jgi:hypothetical protein
MVLKEFKNLTITGDPAACATFVDQISGQLTEGWRRAKGLEESIPESGNLACFACEAAPGRAAAALWIASRTGGGLYVSNIVPMGQQQLRYDEYNVVLDEFVNRFARAVADRLGLTLVVTDGVLRIESKLSPAAFDALKSFSIGANKSTGSSHPMDADRWFAFVVLAHKDRSPLASDDLGRWLRSEGWDDDQAFGLIVEYEQFRNLLRFYDNSR